jgi:glycosyltransferase involved in cell wall biosynthesis
MAKRPIVSIVTPSFNQAEYLEATIQSVLEQSYPNIQYIVIDGGSTDGSADIIKRYARKLDFWQSQKDAGQTDAINQGFAQAKGKYMAWLNADDVYLPHAVEEAVTFLESHTETGMVYGDADFIDGTGRVIGRFPARQTDYKRLMRGYVHVAQQSAFWRADLWNKLGPLDPSFYFAMDYDLWLRLAKHSTLSYHPRVWAQFRMHAASKTMQDDMLAWPEMLKVHQREGGKPLSLIHLKYALRRLLRPLLAFRHQWRLRG